MNDSVIPCELPEASMFTVILIERTLLADVKLAEYSPSEIRSEATLVDSPNEKVSPKTLSTAA